jgi:hypothetical protein
LKDIILVLLRLTCNAWSLRDGPKVSNYFWRLVVYWHRRTMSSTNNKKEVHITKTKKPPILTIDFEIRCSNLSIYSPKSVSESGAWKIKDLGRGHALEIEPIKP